MRTPSVVYRFDRFAFEPGRRRLTRDGEYVPLRASCVEILRCFLEHPGELLSTDTLIAAGWSGRDIGESSLPTAVSRLKKTLGVRAGGAPFIENISGRGYRFLADVQRGAPAATRELVDALVDKYREFSKGRALLETLDLGSIANARSAYEEAVRLEADSAPWHIGLATACLLQYESTRVDIAPDTASLACAIWHAHEAVRLDRESGDAWSTLALVLFCQGDGVGAIAAARTAIGRERRNWYHQLCLAFVSWGGQRLRAAEDLKRRYPELALSHWFTATVFVGLQLFDDAMEELEIGSAAQDAQRTQTHRFNTVGLHLLRGLLLAARGDYAGALDAFARELAGLDARHVYGRECAANTWYAIGAIRLRQGQPEEAAVAFHEALTRVPGHAMAAVGQMAVTLLSSASLTPSSAFSAFSDSARTSLLERTGTTNPVLAATVQAAVLALVGDHHGGARLCAEVLSNAPPGSAGYLLSLDPLINATAHLDAWAHTLAIVRHRAA